MTLKAKWEKLHFGTQDTYTWVFADGRMFVIGDSAHDRSSYDLVKQDKINNNTLYEGTNIKREKLKDHS